MKNLYINNLLKILIFLCMFIIVDAKEVLMNDSNTASYNVTKVNIETLQKEYDNPKIALNTTEQKVKDTESYKDIIARQDKRIESVGVYISAAGVIIAILSVIIGVGGVILPIMLYKSNIKAREEEKQQIKDLLKETRSEIKTLKDDIRRKSKTLDNLSKKAKDKYLELFRKINELSLQNRTPVKIEDNSKSKIVDKAERKIESEYSLDDWIKLAENSNSQGQKNDAIYYWRKAIELVEPSNIKTAQILYNIAVLHFELNNYKESLSTYNSIIQKFKPGEIDLIDIILAKTFFNLGFVFIHMNNIKDAIDVWNGLIKTFKDTTNEIIRKLVQEATIAKESLDSIETDELPT